MGVQRDSEGESESGERREKGARVCKEIERETGTIRLRDDGIVHVIVKTNADVTVDRARVLNAAVREVCDGPAPILCDIREMRRTSILTQRFTAGPEGAAVTLKLALMVDSPVSRMFGNVLLGLAKTSFPTRLFTDEDAAAAWLLADSAEDAADDEDAGRGVDDGAAA
jgi:hypothetical protein